MRQQLCTVSLVTMATQQVERQTDRSKGRGVKARDDANKQAFNVRERNYVPVRVWLC